MAWRAAKSLLVLRDQINVRFPNRNKASDGIKGDDAHAATQSDHNPNAAGVVCALDITHDPRNGVDAGVIARHLAASRDYRIKYLISNAQICSGDAGPSPWVWRKYTGRNPHTMHFHLSVKSSAAHADSEVPWKLDGLPKSPVGKTISFTARPTLRKGSKGEHVRHLQSKLNVSVDGTFGPRTEAALKAFQKSKGLFVDGVAGPYTWAALG